MIRLKENFMVDQKGHRIGVYFGMSDYKKIMRELEELEDIRAYDAAKESNETPESFEQAIEEIELSHK